jgi:hypothetical protein
MAIIPCSEPDVIYLRCQLLSARSTVHFCPGRAAPQSRQTTPRRRWDDPLAGGLGFDQFGNRPYDSVGPHSATFGQADSLRSNPPFAPVLDSELQACRMRPDTDTPRAMAGRTTLPGAWRSGQMGPDGGAFDRMVRVRFRDVAGGDGYCEAIFRKPVDPPPKGYTLNTFVTEWLTETCHGDWASSSLSGRAVVVRFFNRGDFERARARFTPNIPWRSARSLAHAGFQHPARSGDG